jgi:hypothetical protein
MSGILSDAAFSTVEITENFYFRQKLLIDSQRNIHANAVYCNTLVYNNLEHSSGGIVATQSNTRGFTGSAFDVYDNNKEQNFNLNVEGRNLHIHDMIEKLQGDQNVHSEEVGAIAIGGQFSEASGEYAMCLGGKYNEASGKQSVSLGGVENQAIGECSVAMGVTSIALHDHSLVWNSNPNTIVETTDSKQVMVGCDNGLFFKLPKSTDIKTHIVPDGFACWCWDHDHNTLCLKTKQNDVLYKTLLPSLVHDIKVQINPLNGNVVLVNPDDS